MGGIYARRVTSETELEEVYRLRYKVYVEEWGFERAEDHPKGLEYDEFDEHSIHFIEFDDEKRVIGTARVILSSDRGFPLDQHCTIDADLSTLDRKKFGEISRLAISKEFRRRLEDRYIYGPRTDVPAETPKDIEDKRKRQEYVIRLFCCIYAQSKIAGLTHWIAVMARGLHLLLRRMGIRFTPIGPELDYHGVRTPYILGVKDMEDDLGRLNPELLDEFKSELMRNLESRP